MSTSRSSAAEQLRKIRLHLPEGRESCDLKGVRDYLSSLFTTVDVRISRSPLSSLREVSVEEVGTWLVRSRVKDPGLSRQHFEPMLGEIDYEARILRGIAGPSGVVYDARELLDLYAKHMGGDLKSAEAAIVFTHRLISTYSHDDLRHHLRMLVCGFPSLISVPGVVEAPAKPREYYLLRQQLESLGAGAVRLEQLKREFQGRIVDYGDDEAIEEALKGLALQAVMFHLTLRPFCSDRRCRLFNAHWQEELVASQLRGRGLCRRHAALISRLGRRPTVSW